MISSYFTALRIIFKTFKVIGVQHQLTLVCNMKGNKFFPIQKMSSF